MGSDVLLGAACGRMAPSPVFFDDFYRVKLPTTNSARMRATSASISQNMNAIIMTALQADFDYIVYVDDDLRFEPDFVTRLLSHGKDRVAPLVCQRIPPFQPFTFKGWTEQKGFEYLVLTAEHQGLIRVPMFAGMPGLIATKIFRKLSWPYFPENIYREDGSWLQADLQFSKKLYDAGVETWCDLDCVAQHTGQFHVSTVFDAETQSWRPNLNFVETFTKSATLEEAVLQGVRR